MTNEIVPPTHDTTQEVRGNEKGTKGPLFGNEYDSHVHNSPAEVAVGADDGGTAIDPLAETSGPDEAIPPDAGARGWVDQATGEVHGSGAGAGGGQPGEDFDADDAGGTGGDEQAR